jgi:GNAT superfamily N-acetyltransferase
VQGKTTISFETRLLRECIQITRKVDEECFPSEMWLGDTELHHLIEHDAEATILKLNGRWIGQAITIPEHSIADTLMESDEHFQSHDGGVYSYSEAILPQYQNQGYGGLLLHEISLRMKQRGFISISAHVRTRFGWSLKRRKMLDVSVTRTIEAFWEDPLEVVQYQFSRL